MSERPNSSIPVLKNKRASLSLATPVLQSSTSSTNANSASGSRASSPLTLSNPPKGRQSPLELGRRRSSLLGGTSTSRKTSFSENGENDPSEISHLKAQIALLQSSLHGAHQRIMELSASAGLDTSISTSPGGLSAGTRGSPLPWTPLNGPAPLPDVEGSMPLQGLVEEDVAGEMETATRDIPSSEVALEDAKPRLPHSSAEYDLRGHAVTPAKGDKGHGRLGLSRIPHSAVPLAVSLHPTPPHATTYTMQNSRPDNSTGSSPSTSTHLRSPFLAPDSPHSPSSTNLLSDDRLSPSLRKASGSSAASTRVIDNLQTELVNTKGHLERIKQEVLKSRRVIESLTRQTEDLKETRERMRMECEGLNNVIARKERLLQEVLERARTAESALATHQANKKAIEQSTKKQLQAMTSQLTDSQVSQARAEREERALRESVKSLRDVWTREVKAVREEVKRTEEKGRKEREEAREKHLALVKLVEQQSEERSHIAKLAEQAIKDNALATKAFEDQIRELRQQADKSNEDTRSARAIAVELAEELVRLRRVMRGPRRPSLEDVSQLGQLDGDAET
ncbi:hypothetical protein BCR39DRAFT_175626 [Naematelia encephala]|uniref:SWI5-dependent HO expression protein 3 n=1 Tax=Naematelia encephala TaxID=71784 RepID=A0A1Y2B3G1_9TREE|nr:hypothetical protein BCR39DRAFT_175626 [Naematelia encephala]